MYIKKIYFMETPLQINCDGKTDDILSQMKISNMQSINFSKIQISSFITNLY